MADDNSLPVAADIARAWTLPASLYIAPSIFEDEKNKIFTLRIPTRIAQIGVVDMSASSAAFAARNRATRLRGDIRKPAKT